MGMMLERAPFRPLPPRVPPETLRYCRLEGIGLPSVPAAPPLAARLRRLLGRWVLRSRLAPRPKSTKG